MQIIRRGFSQLSAIVLALFVASCAVTLVAPYDPITDAAVQDLAKKTEIVIADVLATRAPYREHADFYREAQGSIRAIEMRASLYSKNEAEMEVLGKLRTALTNLQRIHQEVGPFRPAEAEGVRSLFRSLIHHELSKKRSAGISAPTANQ
jgi:hypothetical protein